MEEGTCKSTLKSTRMFHSHESWQRRKHPFRFKSPTGSREHTLEVRGLSWNHVGGTGKSRPRSTRRGTLSDHHDETAIETLSALQSKFAKFQDEKCPAATVENGNVSQVLPVKKKKKTYGNKELLYAVDDVPPWHLSFLLGFQVSTRKKKRDMLFILLFSLRLFFSRRLRSTAGCVPL